MDERYDSTRGRRWSAEEALLVCYDLAMSTISRRGFLENVSAVAAITMVSTRAQSSSLARGSEPFFFDERFAQAKQLARQLNSSPLTPVQADVTPIWDATLKQVTRAFPSMLHGITTESFYFCLTTMLKEHAQIETSIERVHHDLYLWSIRATSSDRTNSRHLGFSDG